MDIVAKIRDFIIKLQNLSDKNKKIILWTIVGILAVGMGYFWIIDVANSLSKIGESVKSINLPAINLPSTNISQTTTPSDENSIQNMPNNK